jgi:nucleotide-binding universal stress UspA family protein
MRYVVGYSPDQGGREALALGAVLARSSGASLLVSRIIPETWGHPSMAKVDQEYAEFLQQNAKASLAKAKAGLAADISADFVARTAPSARDGLCLTAADVGADAIVLGSARAAPAGRFGLGGASSDILHFAHLPVVVAPKGYAADERTRVKRISCAFSGAAGASSLARRSAEFCKAFQVPLRLVTFVVRDQQMYPTGAGYDVENLVSNQLRRQASTAQDAVIEHWDDSVPISGEIGDGPTWRAAFDSLLWAKAELLVIGSSELGPILRVFLGSNSGKIAQNSPVPCVVMPRSGDGEA